MCCRDNWTSEPKNLTLRLGKPLIFKTKTSLYGSSSTLDNLLLTQVRSSLFRDQISTSNPLLNISLSTVNNKTTSKKLSLKPLPKSCHVLIPNNQPSLKILMPKELPKFLKRKRKNCFWLTLNTRLPQFTTYLKYPTDTSLPTTARSDPDVSILPLLNYLLNLFYKPLILQKSTLETSNSIIFTTMSMKIKSFSSTSMTTPNLSPQLTFLPEYQRT